jgi:hypothetical protein
VPGRAVELKLPATSEEIMKYLCESDESERPVRGKTESSIALGNAEANLNANAQF